MNFYRATHCGKQTATLGGWVWTSAKSQPVWRPKCYQLQKQWIGDPPEKTKWTNYQSRCIILSEWEWNNSFFFLVYSLPLNCLHPSAHLRKPKIPEMYSFTEKKKQKQEVLSSEIIYTPKHVQVKTLSVALTSGETLQNSCYAVLSTDVCKTSDSQQGTDHRCDSEERQHNENGSTQEARRPGSLTGLITNGARTLNGVLGTMSLPVWGRTWPLRTTSNQKYELPLMQLGYSPKSIQE